MSDLLMLKLVMGHTLATAKDKTGRFTTTETTYLSFSVGSAFQVIGEVSRENGDLVEEIEEKTNSSIDSE